MEPTDILIAIRTMNTLLRLGTDWIETAQHVGDVIQTSIENDEPIPQDEWDYIVDQSDNADVALAQAISDA